MKILVESFIVLMFLSKISFAFAQGSEIEFEGTQKFSSITLPCDIDENKDRSIANLINANYFLEKLELKAPFVTIKMAMKRLNKADFDIVQNIAKSLKSQTKLRDLSFDFSAYASY